MATMMKCGHAAQGVRVEKDGTRVPTCLICVGISPGATEVDTSPLDLTGRRARCTYFGTRHRGTFCQSEVPSSASLAFFEHCPTSDMDRYYCGCWGWD